MTAAEFQSAAIALLPRGAGWQTAIACELRVSDRTVRRWIKTGRVPDWVAVKIAHAQREPAFSATYPTP